MSMRRRASEKQNEIWIATSSLSRSPGHPFYERLNAILSEVGFDRYVESLCSKFYSDRAGRPSIPPGTYMRMLFIGFFEGLDSERGIAWRCSDSLALRSFLGFDLSQATPDHSSLSRIRGRLDVETHQAVFAFVLKVLTEKGLLSGKTLGIDSTTLEANAALKSIVRRDDGTGYHDYLVSLAQSSGIETPTREDLARLDRKRAKKGSNDDWTNPHDPEAKIVKMKDGSTHLAHKAEHAVDMESGAVIAVTIQDAVAGDPTSMLETMRVSLENVRSVVKTTADAQIATPSEWVADKGYHANDTMEMVAELGDRSYVSEPKRGKRRWRDRAQARDATYANRRRMKSERGKALMRKRGELIERSFAHTLETGGMRRAHLRGQSNILKRYLVHVAGFNLSLVMRAILGFGTPRGLQGRLAELCASLRALVVELFKILAGITCDRSHFGRQFELQPSQGLTAGRDAFSTGC
jgi:transposase